MIDRTLKLDSYFSRHVRNSTPSNALVASCFYIIRSDPLARPYRHNIRAATARHRQSACRTASAFGSSPPVAATTARIPAQPALFARFRRQPHRMRQVVVQPVQPCLSGISSAAPHGISRVPVEPFAVLPCSQIPARPPRQAIAAFRYCRRVPLRPPAPAMRSFRDSIARPTDSLCTLRAVVAAGYATLASEWWLTFLVSSFQTTGFIQSMSLLLCTSFDYGLFTARTDVTLCASRR